MLWFVISKLIWMVSEFPNTYKIIWDVKMIVKLFLATELKLIQAFIKWNCCTSTRKHILVHGKVVLDNIPTAFYTPSTLFYILEWVENMWFFICYRKNGEHSLSYKLTCNVVAENTRCYNVSRTRKHAFQILTRSSTMDIWCACLWPNFSRTRSARQNQGAGTRKCGTIKINKNLKKWLSSKIHYSFTARRSLNVL